jgi:hypothetical protein
VQTPHVNEKAALRRRRKIQNVAGGVKLTASFMGGERIISNLLPKYYQIEKIEMGNLEV